ncbi:MAG: hypothetical protein ACLFNU_07125 [Bacteroidales bacterium]
MEKKKISERKVILYTASFVVLAGIVRFIAYSFGTVLFYLAFAPFLIYRIVSSVKNREKQKDTIYFYRVIVLSVMIVTIALNIAGWQEADFFLIFLLMIDYLLVINRKF